MSGAIDLLTHRPKHYLGYHTDLQVVENLSRAMLGQPQAGDFDRAVCASKLYSAQCIATATNLAWLMAGSLRRRTAAYRCPHCRQFHVSAHRLDGPNAVLCSWPGAR